VLFHEFGKHLVFASEFGFELLDLAILGVIGGLGFATPVESGMAVLEELLEPGVELRGVDVVFIAQVGNGHLFDEVLFENGDLVGAQDVAALLGHDDCTSVWVMLTQTERTSRFD
jgi:hypothetical protein